MNFPVQVFKGRGHHRYIINLQVEAIQIYTSTQIIGYNISFIQSIQITQRCARIIKSHNIKCTLIQATEENCNILSTAYISIA